MESNCNCRKAGCTSYQLKGIKEEITGGEHDSNKALHYSEGKSGVDQIPVEVLLEWGDVFSYGEKKYYRNNWLKGNKFHEFYGSALRHIFAFWEGQEMDSESGIHHLAHAIWNLAALRYYQLHGLGEDDRPLLIEPVPDLEEESNE